MDCPKCKLPLGDVEVGPVRVSLCSHCNGTWYDRNELRVLEARESHGDYCWIDIDLWRERDKFRARKQQRYSCPRDGQPMETVHYGESTVAVDICAKCQGIWLDRKEYDGIVRYLDEIVDTSSTGDYLRDIRHEVAEALRGHEGPLHALRDVGKIFYLLEMRFCSDHPDLATAAARNMPRF